MQDPGKILIKKALVMGPTVLRCYTQKLFLQ